MANNRGDPGRDVQSRQLVLGAFALARSLEISKLLIQADELHDAGLVERHRAAEQLIWLTHRLPGRLHPFGRQDEVVEFPDAPLTRMSQVKFGLFLTAARGLVDLDETVVCLAGLPGSGRLDLLMITTPRREFPWMHQHVDQLRGLVATREFPRVLDVALSFAAQGREGKPIGALFVLGEAKEVSPYLRQLILNPLAGHARTKRDIHNREFLETLRELAALDGAFVVTSEGVVESAGTYIDAPTTRADLQQGFGARHAAAAAITAATAAIAVAVSESSGTVTVFHRGKVVLEMEKAAPC